ncbi:MULTISPECIES: hypothetical protein [unclassified Mesorhizobium]|uniref:hypothetical protein n=1 Tax=unclassified Mesorhizobium TaxID=325217 RepID=UPI001FE1D03E|nr:MULTISPECIES: hypothetical protein [unclassified Mesorhizobium]
MIQALFDCQREIYLAVAQHLKSFAANGSRLALLAVLSMGVVFGAAHAITPGHSKTLLAAYITGSRVRLSRGAAGVAGVILHPHHPCRADCGAGAAAGLDCAGQRWPRSRPWKHLAGAFSDW